MMNPFFSTTILQPGIAFTTSLIPEMPLLQGKFGLETDTAHVTDAHQTNLTLPTVHTSKEGTLDLHVDDCHRRCVTISDSQRILQFGHSSF
jgi:hypothetical protein